MKKRIFVEKKGIFDVESPKILTEIKSILPNVENVKVYNIYDVFGLSESDFSKTVGSVFADPITDIIHTENPAQEQYFATEFLPGQYDQRADSAEQCISLLTGTDNAAVRSGKLIEIKGISSVDLDKVKDLLINKVESREKDLSKLEIPAQEKPTPVIVHEGFIGFNETELEQFYKQHGFAFGFDDLLFIQNYFQSENRNLRRLFRKKKVLRKRSETDFAHGFGNCLRQIFP